MKLFGTHHVQLSDGTVWAVDREDEHGTSLEWTLRYGTREEREESSRGYWVWGIRPWRGCPFFMLVVDVADAARQSKKHLAECEECGATPFTPDPGRTK